MELFILFIALIYLAINTGIVLAFGKLGRMSFFDTVLILGFGVFILFYIK